MLRTFPKEMLKKIPADILDEFYARKGVEAPEVDEKEEQSVFLTVCWNEEIRNQQKGNRVNVTLNVKTIELHIEQSGHSKPWQNSKWFQMFEYR